jgi:hypothetical protein
MEYRMIENKDGKQYKYYSLKESELTESMVIALNVSFILGSDPYDEWCEDYEAIDWWKLYETEMKEVGIEKLKEWRNIPPFYYKDKEEYIISDWSQLKIINNTEKAEKLVKSYDAASETEKESINTQLNTLLK